MRLVVLVLGLAVASVHATAWPVTAAGHRCAKLTGGQWGNSPVFEPFRDTSGYTVAQCQALCEADSHCAAFDLQNSCPNDACTCSLYKTADCVTETVASAMSVYRNPAATAAVDSAADSRRRRYVRRRRRRYVRRRRRRYVRRRRRRYARRRRRYVRRRRQAYPECLAGTYLDGYTCTSCPAGKYQPYAGATECSACGACDPGMIRTTCSAASEGICTSCEAGKFKTGYGDALTQCTTCDLGKYQSNAGSDGCLDCAAGKFARSGHTACFQCPAGKYSSTETSTDCNSCRPGTAAEAGKTFCDTCSSGTYQHLSGERVCNACAPGRFQTEVGRTFCDTCDPGTIQPGSGHTSCVACPTGQYQRAVGRATCDACTTCAGGAYLNGCGGASLGVCTDCPPGKFKGAALTWDAQCTDCGLGRYTGVKAQTECMDCDAGKYARQGHSVCSLCPTGQFTATTSSTDCQYCIPGTAASSEGSDSCEDCLAGTYQHLSGVHECLDCPAGKFSAERHSTVCIACNNGKISARPGQSSCTACESGKYQAFNGWHVCSTCGTCHRGLWRVGCSGSTAGVCTSCPIGKFKNLYAHTQCTDCSAGKYANAVGLTECSSCTAGQYSRVGHTYCFACPTGKYQHDTSSGVCAACAPGAAAVAAGAVVCTMCESGKYQLLWGSHECHECPAGKYNPSTSRTYCSDCPECTSSDAAASSCNSLARDCTVSDWSGWGTCDESCGDGHAHRTREMDVVPACGGTACPTLTDAAQCMLKPCECAKVKCEYEHHECSEYYNDPKVVKGCVYGLDDLDPAFCDSNPMVWSNKAGATCKQGTCRDKETNAGGCTLDGGPFGAACQAVELACRAVDLGTAVAGQTCTVADRKGLEQRWQSYWQTCSGTHQSLRVYHHMEERRFKRDDGQTHNNIEGHHCKNVGGTYVGGVYTGGTCSCRCHSMFRHAQEADGDAPYNPFSCNYESCQADQSLYDHSYFSTYDSTEEAADNGIHGGAA